ncbi:MAG: hypothetical protein GVY28_10175 [Alphaproteobacteria bacterium]|jgi:hypothetical protein|nr:hypothetical protein [Alphaproteobacteria bacterium]
MSSLRDPALRRRFHRIDTPRFRAEVCGWPATTKDWSWGGVAFEMDGAVPADLAADQTIVGLLSLPSRPMPCPVRGRVVRIDAASRTVAVELIDLTEEVFRLFEGVLRAHLPPRDPPAAEPTVPSAPTRNRVIAGPLRRTA